MKHILFLSETSYPCDESMYIDSLSKNLPSSYTASVIYATNGHRAQLQYLDAVDNVVSDLCYESHREDWGSMVAEYIDEFAVDVVVTSASSFGDFDVSSGVLNTHSVDGIIDSTKSKPPVIFAAYDYYKDIKKRIEQVRANGYIVLSDTYAKYFTDVCEKTPSVVRGGIDESVIMHSSNNIRKYHGIKDDDFVVGYIGKLDPLYCIEQLADACKSLHAKLLVAGYGSLTDTISKYEHCIITPFIPTNRTAWYNAFNVFAYPANRSTFPVFCAEAMVHKVPVVMSPVADFSSMFADEATFVIPNTENIIAGIRTASQRRNVLAVKEKVLARLSIKNMVNDFTGVIENCM